MAGALNPAAESANALAIRAGKRNAGALGPGIAKSEVIKVMTVFLTAYHATWKPPRAPTSPLSKPTPIPAETDALSETRALIAMVPAPWSSK